MISSPFFSPLQFLSCSSFKFLTSSSIIIITHTLTDSLSTHTQTNNPPPQTLKTIESTEYCLLYVYLGLTDYLKLITQQIPHPGANIFPFSVAIEQCFI